MEFVVPKECRLSSSSPSLFKQIYILPFTGFSGAYSLHQILTEQSCGTFMISIQAGGLQDTNACFLVRKSDQYSCAEIFHEQPCLPIGKLYFVWAPFEAPFLFLTDMETNLLNPKFSQLLHIQVQMHQA